MGRRLKDAQLDNRTSRAKLAARSEPYWRLVSEGQHVGYYRGLRGGRWVARYRKPGAAGGYQKASLGEADDNSDADGARVLDWSQAQDAARLWFGGMVRGRAKVGPYTVGDALDDYVDDFTGKSISSTKYTTEAVIRPVLGAIELAELTTEQVYKWHRDIAKKAAMLRSKAGSEQKFRSLGDDESLRRRRSTANRNLTVLKAALNRAFHRGKVESDLAWRKVKPFQGVEHSKLRYLSTEEARRLVNACDPTFRPLVQAALLTGMRYGEMCAMRVRDVSLESETLMLPVTKGNKPRAVYLEQEGCSLFGTLIAGKKHGDLVFTKADGGPWKQSEQSRPMAAACAAGKIEPVASFHDLRRTYGARLALRGVPMAVIAEALGHADERITRKHYAHLAPSYVAQTVRENIVGLDIVERSNVVQIAG